MRHKRTFLAKQILYLLVLVPILAMGCKKDDRIDITDIKEHNWELKSITKNGEKAKTPNNDFVRSESYILNFKNDSTFRLNLSSNIGGGKYNIIEKGEITIDSYHNFTEAAQLDFDDKLTDVFNEVTSYEVSGNVLIFKGSKGEVKFKKE